MSSIDDIKSKIDIIDLVGEYVELRKAGVNFKGLCPFHGEKTPSFVVSREKQIWHCFGCGKGGDAFKFLMEKEGMDFGEALRVLARKVGVILQNEDRQISGERTKLLAILDLATKFYHRNLLSSPEAEAAREYLRGRGLTAETVVKFSLGFAPTNFDSLINFLTPKHKIDDLIKAGLVLKREKRAGEVSMGRDFYDRFRGRIMFPIADVWGHVVGFTGRIMPQDEAREGVGGKYVNTPTTPVYNKSGVLYGLTLAREAIKKENKVIIVEGNMDVISSHQAGVTNVVASSGTALTIDQIRLLKRFTNNIILAFDADFAGQGASERGIGEALCEDINVKVLRMPESGSTAAPINDAGQASSLDNKVIAKDPDELIRKSPDLWVKAIAEAEPFVEYVFWKNKCGADLTRIEDKKNLSKILVQAISLINDPLERSMWIKEMSGRLNLSENSFAEAVEQVIQQSVKLNRFKPVHQKEAEAQSPLRSSNRRRQLEERVVSLCLIYPSLWEQPQENTGFSVVSSGDLKSLLDVLPACYNNVDKIFNEELIKENLKAVGINPELFDILSLLADKDFAEAPKEVLHLEFKKCLGGLADLDLREARQSLTEELRQAEKYGDFTKIHELSKRLNELMYK